jgi:aerobic-type carbon monoxide dehydrogenase small subunit (CoxS/CutS family)
MKRFTIEVNVCARRIRTEPGTPSRYALSNELDLKSPRFDCGLDQYGSCIVPRIVTGFRQIFNEQGSQS